MTFGPQPYASAVWVDTDVDKLGLRQSGVRADANLAAIIRPCPVAVYRRAT